MERRSLERIFVTKKKLSFTLLSTNFNIYFEIPASNNFFL